MEELHKKLGLEDLATLIRRQRLRCFGHVERSSEEKSEGLGLCPSMLGEALAGP